MTRDPAFDCHDESIEIVRTVAAHGAYRVAVFDFDGTLSLLRRNWQEVMIPMMVEVLQQTGTAETHDELRQCVEQFVTRLTGHQTIVQMIRLAEEVRRRGGTPEDPLQYKRRYHERLWKIVEPRIRAVREGSIPADEMLVPGSIELLEALRNKGLALYLTSGTDVQYVEHEAAVLGLDRMFDGRIYGAVDDYRRFSKGMIVDRILRQWQIEGRQLLGFGDGFVEIEEVKRVGGTAVGVASNETTRRGVNAWKRARLIEAGADIIVPHFGNWPALLRVLGLEPGAEAQ